MFPSCKSLDDWLTDFPYIVIIRLTTSFLTRSHLITSTIIKKIVGKKLEFANSLGLGQVHVQKLGCK